jgi:hypothetical protein
MKTLRRGVRNQGGGKMKTLRVSALALFVMVAPMTTLIMCTPHAMGAEKKAPKATVAEAEDMLLAPIEEDGEQVQDKEKKQKDGGVVRMQSCYVKIVNGRQVLVCS